MQAPVLVTYRHVDPSLALSARVRELAEELERFRSRIMRCDVTIEAPPGREQEGGVLAVKVQVTIPGGVLNANSVHAAQPQHLDVYVALRDTFDSIKRQLQAETEAPA